jgi:hypothetical protein
VETRVGLWPMNGLHFFVLKRNLLDSASLFPFS